MANGPNSRASVRISEPPSGGIDGLDLTFPVVEETEMLWWDADHGSPHGVKKDAFWRVGREAVFFRLSEYQGRLRGRLSLNPSRVVDPDGDSLCSYDDVMGAILSVLRDPPLLKVVSLRQSPDEWSVTRLHLARDFYGVESLRPYAEAFWLRRPRYTKAVHLYRGRGDGVTLEFSAGKPGRVVLYDKAAESRGLAPPGVVRFEVQARKEWVNRFGRVKVLGDLTPDRMHALLEERWRWSGFGAPVGSPGLHGVLAAVRGLGLSQAREETFLGWLIEQSLGLGGQPSNDRRAGYCRLLKQLGIVTGPHLLAAPGRPRSLDLASGKEMTGTGTECVSRKC